MLTTMYKIAWKLNRINALIRGYLYPFKRIGKGRILIEVGCEFKNPHWISLGGKNIIQRGAVIWADSPDSIQIGEDTSISRYSIIQSVGGQIKIGNRSQIGDLCNLYGQGGLVIGNDVMFASCIQVVPNQHTFTDLSIPMRQQPSVSKGIVIEDNVWIGTQVTILDGVRIGTGSIVAAGALVNKDVDPYTIVAGIPARKIKDRKQKDQ